MEITKKNSPKKLFFKGGTLPIYACNQFEMKKSVEGATLRLTQNVDFESNIPQFICIFSLSSESRYLSVTVVDDNDNSPLWIDQVYELSEFEEVLFL